MVGTLQLVDRLVWVFACCDHAGEDGHDDQEDGEVLHFRLGFVFVRGLGFSRLLGGKILLERGIGGVYGHGLQSCTLFGLTTILRCLLQLKPVEGVAWTKKFGSTIRTWAYASGMLNGQCYIGYCSPAVCAIVMFVTSQCRLEIEGEQSGPDEPFSW
jgi:hypothetical protein